MSDDEQLQIRLDPCHDLGFMKTNSQEHQHCKPNPGFEKRCCLVPSDQSGWNGRAGPVCFSFAEMVAPNLMFEPRD